MTPTVPAPEESAWVQSMLEAAPLHPAVRVVLEPAPVDLADPHALAWTRGRELHVAVIGLRGGAVGPSADALVERAVTHALVHLADQREGWSRSRAWRALSAWPAGGGPAGEHALDAFASAAAQESTAEDLASTATALLDAVRAPPADADQDPRCRLASKARFVGPLVGGVPTRACSTLAEVGLDPASIDAIELIYATGSLGSVASVAGHVMLALRYRPVDGVARTDVYSLVALTDGGMTLGRAFRGLVTGLPSSIRRDPLEAVLQGYARHDNRDVRTYELRLSPEETTRLLGRLDELRQGWDRPYLFFTRNCTALPAELLRAVFADFRPPDPLAPDLLLGLLDRRGRLEPLPPTRIEEVAIQTRALTADRLRVAAARALGPTTPAARDALKRSPDARIAAYTSLGATAADPLAVDRFLALSDIYEQALIETSAKDAPDSPDEPPTIAALRAAKADVRTRALAEGIPLAAFHAPDPEILAATTGPRDHMGTHGPLRSLDLFGRADADTVWLGAGTALYASRIAQPRRYSVGATSGFTVLATAWSVSTAGDLRAEGVLADVRRLAPHRGPLATGGYLTVGAVDRWTPRSLDARWLEGGGTLGLWRGAEGGALAWVSAGLGVGSRGLGELGAEVPLTLHAELGSTHQALTGVAVDARWAPQLGTTWTQRAKGEAEGRLRLGELAGADVGLVVRGEVEAEGALSGAWTGGTAGWRAMGGLGVRVERF